MHLSVPVVPRGCQPEPQQCTTLRPPKPTDHAALDSSAAPMGGWVASGWVGSRPLPGVAFPARHDWTRAARISGHKACRNADSPQTTPCASVQDMSPWLCVFPVCRTWGSPLGAHWVTRAAPGLVRGGGQRGLHVGSLVHGGQGPSREHIPLALACNTSAPGVRPPVVQDPRAQTDSS